MIMKGALSRNFVRIMSNYSSFTEVGPTTLNKSGLVFYRDIRMLVGTFYLSHLTKPGQNLGKSNSFKLKTFANNYRNDEIVSLSHKSLINKKAIVLVYFHS